MNADSVASKNRGRRLNFKNSHLIRLTNTFTSGYALEVILQRILTGVCLPNFQAIF